LHPSEQFALLVDDWDLSQGKLMVSEARDENRTMRRGSSLSKCSTECRCGITINRYFGVKIDGKIS
jgi:hypothetical protein